MIPFDLAEPTSLSDAIKLLDPDDPTIRPVGGGTALMLMMKAGVFKPEKLVSLRRIEKKYSAIAADGGGIGDSLVEPDRFDEVSAARTRAAERGIPIVLPVLTAKDTAAAAPSSGRSQMTYASTSPKAWACC